jgi:hypothetical protein
MGIEKAAQTIKVAILSFEPDGEVLQKGRFESRRKGKIGRNGRSGRPVE